MADEILPAFTFLDPKVLAQLIALLLIWVQFIKEYIPDKWIKLFSMGSALVFIFLVDSCTGGPCSAVIPSWIAQPILYAVVSASAAGLGYKALAPKNTP